MLGVVVVVLGDACPVSPKRLGPWLGVDKERGKDFVKL